MDINQTINFSASNVADITEIAPGHPVYRVSFNPDPPHNNPAFISTMPDVVIKVENAAHRRHVTDHIKIMNAVDPQAKTRQLKPQEIQTLKTTLWGYRIPKLIEDLELATRHHAVGTTKPVIIVMKAKDNLIDLNSAGQRENGDKSGVKTIRKILNQPSALEKLGKILAADAFNGNQDRVEFYRIGTMGQQRLQAIQNMGNFFFNDNGFEAEVLGLDSFDPGNQFKNLDTFASANQGFTYPGKILHAQASDERLQFTNKLVSDIETLLGSRNRKFPFSSQRHLPSNAADSIARGMETGAREIKNFLKTQYRGKPLSAGLRTRLQALGWLSTQGGGIS